MAYKGLSEKEVIKVRERYGPNTLPKKNEGSILKLLISQFKSPLIYLLLATALVSFLFNEQQDGVLILAVLVLNVSIGFYQEYRAHKTLLALKGMLEPVTTVIREGKRKRVPTHELVPKDIVILGAGDVIPADGKILESINLLVKEAILTGESESISKSHDVDNDVYMGTTVSSGSGIIEIERTGGETKFGKIGKELIAIEERDTPLQISLQKFATVLSIVTVVIALIIFLVGIYYDNEPLLMLRYAIVLAVAVIPEGLPVVVTVILARGMKRILKQKGLVKNLISVETLGATTVICTDKTGTLTTGNMQVVAEEMVDRAKAYEAFLINNEQRTNIEVALWDYVHRNGFDANAFFDNYKRLYLEPFSSETKYALTICSCPLKATGYITGAPEIVMEYCNMGQEEKDTKMKKIEEWATQGYRLMASAYLMNDDPEHLKKKTGYIWSGLIAIADPIREEAGESLKRARDAGIDVKILTGDYRKTAENIALNLGLELRQDQIIEGTEIDNMSVDELSGIIKNKVLFARITPEHKLKIVDALQQNGEVVAMTGDGVNDVLALKRADIGIAMGNAVEVAKEAADLILLNNNFNTIISTVEEGRLVYKNIRKVIGYILSNSFAEITIIFGALLLRLPAPLQVAHILWIHLICDGPPDIALGFDDDKEGLLLEKPHDTRKSFILDKKTRSLIAFISLGIAVIGLGLFYHFYVSVGDYMLAQTMVFLFLCIVDLTYILSYKDLETPLIKIKHIFKNKVIVWALIYGYILTFAAIYVPFIREALKVKEIDIYQWGIIALGALFITIGIEVIKFIRFKD